MTAGQRLVGVAVAAAGLLAVLTVFVVQHARLVDSFDASGHEAVRAFIVARPGWLSVAAWITHLGDTLVVTLVDVTAFTLCLTTGRVRTAVFVAVTGLGVWACRLAMSRLVGRPRPADALWPADDFAFPSGHTANSVTMGVIVVVTGWTLTRGLGRVALVAAAVALAAAVSATRIVGGVHWPTDVLGGILLATAVCSAAATPLLTGQISEFSRNLDRGVGS